MRPRIEATGGYSLILLHVRTSSGVFKTGNGESSQYRLQGRCWAVTTSNR
jgi:hypothetical protein